MLNRPEASALPDPGPAILTDPDHFSYCSLKDFILSSRSLAGTLLSSGFRGTRGNDLGLGEAGDGQDIALGTATASSPVIKRGSFGFVST